MSDSIQVAIKVRPLIKRERDENLQVQWTVVDNAIVPADPEKRRGESSFQFDHIFDPQKTNSDVFETVVRPIVDAAVKGFNGTVFAYGQTSSGKTHTMLGTSDEPGVIPMAVERMFDAIAETCGREFLLRVSYLEIYNEKVNDLLETSSLDLKLREDNNGLVQVLKCKEEIASSPDLIMSIMKKGDKNRRIGETDMNERSSRSHTIFRITIESRDQSSDSDGAIQVSQLNLVDLAGSERARQTNATGERFKEGTHINMSLSTLGLVIKQLSESSDNTKYVNFRDSKLTRLLQASLGGNAMTTIVCAVTPAAFEETQCTLWFASRAKSVKNKPQLNEVMSDAALLKRYKKQLARLNEELEKLKHEKGIAEVQEMESKLQEKEHKLQETDRLNQMLEERIELLKNSIVSTGSSSVNDSSSNIPRFKRRRTWAGDRGLSSRFSLGFKNLPSIAETSCTNVNVPSSNKNLDKINRRKSIIQSVNLNEESFETAFTDFELELIKVAKEREEQTDVTDFIVEENNLEKAKSKTENRVKFEDDVQIYRFSNGSNWSNASSTPEKHKSNSNNDKSQESSPGTPKSVLRERINYLTEEYNELKEFTTLEKQILHAEKLDFDSPNEKVLMQNRIDDLVQRLEKSEEKFSISMNCINELSLRTPNVLELWKQSLIIEKKDEDSNDGVGNLNQLLEILKNFKNEQNDATKALTPLEKKLTNDYNECIKELKQVQSQKEQLIKENSEIKMKLVDESIKLKNTNDLVNNLRTDTDCLMEKLIQKNNELAKLKERVVDLERINNEIEKSVSASIDNDVSAKKKNDASTSIQSNLVISNEGMNAEVAKLNEIIEEKSLEISKYRQFEDEIKLENERLQQVLDEVCKREKVSVECQTESILNVDNLKDAQIAKLFEVIEEKSLSITRYQQIELEMKQKIEQLQISLKAMMEQNMDNNVMVDQQFKEESNSSYVIEQKLIRTAHLGSKSDETNVEIIKQKQFEEDKVEKISNLDLELNNLSSTEKIIEESSIVNNHCSEEPVSNYPLSSNNEAYGPLKIIDVKSAKIDKYRESEEESKKEIVQLQQCLKKELEETCFEKSDVKTSSIGFDQIRDDEIARLKDVVQEKAFLIEQYEHTEKQLKSQIARLQENLEVQVRKVNQVSDEGSIEFESTNELQDSNVDLMREKDAQISRLSKFIEEKSFEIAELKESEEKRKEEIEKLKQKLDYTANVHTIVKLRMNDDVVAMEIDDVETSIDKKIGETERGHKIIEERTQEITKFTESEQKMKEKTDGLLKHLDNAVKESQKLQLTQKEKAAVDDEKETDEKETEMRDQLKTYKEEITIASQNAELFAAKSSELELKVASLRDELTANFEELEGLRSSNSELKYRLDEKSKEISSLHCDFNRKVQELEEKLNIVLLERNDYKDKHDSAVCNKQLKVDLEKQTANLQVVVDKLKIENDCLKKRIQSLELESNKVNLSLLVAHERSLSTSPIKSSIPTSVDNICGSERASAVQLQFGNEESPIASVKKEVCTKSVDITTFVKPEDMKVEPDESKHAPALVDNDKRRLPIDKLELESSSIFANMTYFDNMEVGQSFAQDSTSAQCAFATIEESKDTFSVTASVDASVIKLAETEQKSDVSLKELVEGNKQEAEKSIIINKLEITQSFALDKTDIETCTTEELRNKFLLIEKENVRLYHDLQSKIQESDEIQKFIADLKQTLEILQQTIDSLTNDNMSMSRQLTDERENNDRIVNDFQSKIDVLTTQLAKITDEKAYLRNELEIVNERFDNMRAVTPVITDDEMKQKFLKYQDQIKSLTEENITLSTDLMEKIEELERVKESKIQEYDHQCTYRDEADSLFEKIQCLERENIDLSNELTEHLEECDKLKETVDVLKNQLEVYINKSTLEGSERTELDVLKEDNERLTNEMIAMRTKITQLTRENANLSSNLILDSSDEQQQQQQKQRQQESGEPHQQEQQHDVTATASSPQDESFVYGYSLALLEASTSVEENVNEPPANSSLTIKRVKFLEQKVEHLTLMNKRLGELKFKNCSQCKHVKELNESRRQLKLELTKLNHKFSDLEKDFKQKCVETEVLKAKANEDVNASLNLSLAESTLNSSLNFDGTNVTILEEKVNNLHSELEELKENCNRLANQYQEKCSELEKLQIGGGSNAAGTPAPGGSNSKRSKSEGGSARKTSSRIQALQKSQEALSDELQDLKKSYANIQSSLNKIIAEREELAGPAAIESLKLANEELRRECSDARARALTREEKTRLLEEELAGLYKRLEAASAAEKEAQVQRLETEVRLESLLRENSELAGSLRDAEKVGAELREEALQRAAAAVATDAGRASDNRSAATTVEMLQGEIEEVRSRIVREAKCLGGPSELEERALPRRSLVDIFVNFLSLVVSKQTEIVNKLNAESEREQRKLREARQQSVDAEKRANCWAKTLECDLEKLQADLTEQERKNRQLEDRGQSLEHQARELQHENSQLHGQVGGLEADLNQLQSELERRRRSSEERDSALSVAQDRERLARAKEEEWEARLAHEAEGHRRECDKLAGQLESCRALIEDLRSAVEGLELEVEHLKNTNDIKTSDLAAAERRSEELAGEVARVEAANQQLRFEAADRERSNDELVAVLKIKCDLLTEYKTKVETMKPEYESLQAQMAERRLMLDKCKEEAHSLKLEAQRQMDGLRDRLSNEEIKSAGLGKQIAELKNKNTQLCSTIEEFKDRCAELERENASLQRKMRNSTSKARVENEMQELQDENRSLKNHLEGSYNRIKELQEAKSQAQRELAEAQGRSELLEQELNTTRNALEALRDKYNNCNLQKLRDNYEKLLREKNAVVLEVEEKRMLLAGKDQKLVEYGIELDTLGKQKELLEGKHADLAKESELARQRLEDSLAEAQELRRLLEASRREMDAVAKRSKELDDEMDEMVGHIHKLESENAELFDKVITGSSSENIDRIKGLEDERDGLRIAVRVAEVKRAQLETEIVRLASEKEQLLGKIEHVNGRYAELESKFFESRASSRGSSKNNSPTSRSKRGRQRRSNLFNQSRNLEFEHDSREITTDNESPSTTPTPTPTPPPPSTPVPEQCQACNELRNRIREMSLDIVSRNNKITMLEVQLQSENFPYQIKYNELQENVLAIKTRNSELKLEIQKLQRALMEDSSRECQICRQRKLNKRDQGVQAKVDDKICLSGMSSGAVEDHLKIVKLEKERNIMKDLCRSRAKKIKELEQRVREFEGLNTIQI